MTSDKRGDKKNLTSPPVEESLRRCKELLKLIPGRRLQLLREIHGYSRRDLALELGISGETLRRLEHLECLKKSGVRFRQIASILGLEAERFWPELIEDDLVAFDHAPQNRLKDDWWEVLNLDRPGKRYRFALSQLGLNEDEVSQKTGLTAFHVETAVYRRDMEPISVLLDAYKVPLSWVMHGGKPPLNIDPRREIYIQKDLLQELEPGPRVRVVRKVLGVSRAAIKKACGVSETALTDLEKGIEKGSEHRMIIHISSALGLNLRLVWPECTAVADLMDPPGQRLEDELVKEAAAHLRRLISLCHDDRLLIDRVANEAGIVNRNFSASILGRNKSK